MNEAADVVAGQPARKPHPALVVQGQVRADHLPALATVACAVHVLAPERRWKPAVLGLVAQWRSRALVLSSIRFTFQQGAAR